MDKNIKISLDRNMKSIEHSQFLHQRSFKQATEKLDSTFPFPNRRQIEKAVLEYIALGNVTLAEQFIRTSSKDGLLTIDVGNLSENELMQARFTIVFFVVPLSTTVFRRLLLIPSVMYTFNT